MLSVSDHYDIVWTNNMEMVELGLSNLSVIDCRRLEISKNSKMADLGLLNLQVGTMVSAPLLYENSRLPYLPPAPLSMFG